MNVEIEVAPRADFPCIEGPHELAWSYILDHIFSDAYTVGLSTLHFTVPTADLCDEIELRSELTPVREGTDGLGVADLTGAPVSVAATRLYTLRFGRLAPRSLRSAAGAPRGWAPRARLSIYTWKTIAWGVPIRAANLLQRPSVADRAVYAMRRDFTREGNVPSFYHLGVWSMR